MPIYKITSEVLDAMKLMRANHATNHQIARAFGLDEHTVSWNFLNRRKTPIPHDTRTLAQILRHAANKLDAETTNAMPLPAKIT